jgi:hypothetical protein
MMRLTIPVFSITIISILLLSVVSIAFPISESHATHYKGQRHFPPVNLIDSDGDFVKMIPLEYKSSSGTIVTLKEYSGTPIDAPQTSLVIDMEKTFKVRVAESSSYKVAAKSRTDKGIFPTPQYGGNDDWEKVITRGSIYDGSTNYKITYYLKFPSCMTEEEVVFNDPDRTYEIQMIVTVFFTDSTWQKYGLNAAVQGKDKSLPPC